ncbi:unnamed protein product [Medioppia subpectinata]|uniref:Peptidase M14 domain-containing protein n=1 Tax=Medioppia subpectinata TaxID=1979941 RepID=A0A7R9L1F2_9ACAR|nr:unnamed protein product [Medioppia subpectinata]CAG2113811.1 unnamed protein product [Medioppia subpectinata]
MIELSTNKNFNYERMDDSDDDEIYRATSRRNIKPNKTIFKKLQPFLIVLFLLTILVIIVFITIGVVMAYERPANYTGHKVYKLLPLSIRDLNAIIGIEKKYQDPLEPVLIQISSPEEETLIKEELTQLNINFTVSIEDLQKAIEEERVEHQKHSNETEFNFSRYHTYYEIMEFLENNVIKSDFVNIDSIGKSFEGRKIPIIRISSDLKNNTKPVILIDSLIHSKEWVTGSTTLHIMNQLIANQSLRYLIENFEFNLIPIFNPDGYAYSWRSDRLWRKSRSFSITSFLCRGVDLNRNFETNFGTESDEELNSCSDYYSGDYPYSEPEVIAFREFTFKLSLTNRLKAYFSLHSFKQQILYPSDEYNQEFAENSTELQNLAQLAANAIHSHSESAYGSSIDWIHNHLKVKTSFEFKLRDLGEFGYLLPKEMIVPTAQEVLEAIKAILNSSQFVQTLN